MRTLGACLVGALAMLAGGERALAQKQGVYVVQASTRLGKLVDKGNADGYSLYSNKFSLGGGG